jgi:signal transduction histidine kinase
MTQHPPRLLSLIDPAPPGFELIAPGKRHLLAGPVALLLPDLAQLAEVIPDFLQRMQGILITPGNDNGLLPLSPQLWHASLSLPLAPREMALLAGWLDSIAAQDQARQQSSLAEIRSERLTHELANTRQDYNDATSRLLAQVEDLLSIKTELSLANLELESRVERRTRSLAEANANLSKALQDLQQTQAELVRSAQLAGLGSLVAGIAHELNTPIGNALTVSTSMHDEAQKLKASLLTGTLKRSTLERHAQATEQITHIMEKNLRRAADLIGHFKQVAVDQVSEHRRRFNLSEVIDDTLATLSPRLNKGSHKLELQLACDPLLDSYPGAIGQVLSNLIINALVHGFEGRENGTMTLDAHWPIEPANAPTTANESHAQVIEITLTDNGVGILDEHRNRIFDPFFTTKLGQGGSGLGLHIAYNLTTMVLGGKISLDPHFISGTRMRLCLPLNPPRTTTKST